MRRRVLGSGLLVVACAAAALAQGVNLRPGKYEVTAEMQMAGMPIKPQKDVDCVTADHIKNLPTLLVKDEYAEGCKISNVKSTASRVTFDTACVQDGMRYTSSSELTFAADSYAGVMKMKYSDGRTTTVKMSGRRIGACGK